jgi:DNA-binding transcriptional regulator/RsmH inhibitor MraZ
LREEAVKAKEEKAGNAKRVQEVERRETRTIVKGARECTVDGSCRCWPYICSVKAS